MRQSYASWLIVACLLLSAIELPGCTSAVRGASNVPDRLAAGDGVLILSVNTNYFLSFVKLRRQGDVFDTTAALNVGPGHTVRFLVLPAGSYRWSRLEYPDLAGPGRYVPLSSDDKRMKFRIEPGRVNYPGDLNLEFLDIGHLTMHVVDREAMLLRDLDAAQKAVVDRLGLAYSGYGQDRFFDYYQKLRTKRTDSHGR